MKAIAIDGTEIKAWDSRSRNYKRNTVKKQLAEMDKKISEYLKEMDENDEKEKDEVKITNMKEKILSMEKRMKKLGEIKKSMDQSGLDEMSLTDPDARLMETCIGMEVCFNGQISVDDRNNLIVSHNKPTIRQTMLLLYH